MTTANLLDTIVAATRRGSTSAQHDRPLAALGP